MNHLEVNMKRITLDIQISDEIKNYIKSKGFKQGDRLPSERELAEIFNVQRLTVRSALKRLINENLIYSIRGSGNYVSEEKIERDLFEFGSLTKTIERSGHILRNAVIHIKEIESNKKISRNLDIALGTKVYEIKRLRIVDEIPLTFETSYIPVRFIEGIKNFDLENESLYEILEKHYNITLTTANQEISMVFGDEEESELLQVNEGEALLMLKCTALDSEGRKIEYSKSLTRGDRCVFTSVLRKRGN